MKYYFASYGYANGFGSVYITFNKPEFFIKSNAQKHIETKFDLSGVIILYYKEITKKEYETNIKED
jgi:hypothetical protein